MREWEDQVTAQYRFNFVSLLCCFPKEMKTHKCCLNTCYFSFPKSLESYLCNQRKFNREISIYISEGFIKTIKQKRPYSCISIALPSIILFFLLQKPHRNANYRTQHHQASTTNLVLKECFINLHLLIFCHQPSVFIRDSLTKEITLVHPPTFQ